MSTLSRVLGPAFLVVSATALFAGCGGSSGGSSPAATTEFLTADARGFAHDGGLPAGAGGPLVAGTDAATAAADLSAALEEADIFRVDGDRLVLLNAYRGLAVVDLAARTLSGRLAFAGTPVECFVAGERALVLVSNYDSTGALLDVSLADPHAPALRASFPLPIAPRTSRLVGGRLVVVGNGADGDAVHSFLVGTDVTPADTLALPASASFVHASNSLLFVATADANETVVRLVDVSDPAGALALRGSLTFAGSLRGDDKLDFQAGTFRIVTHDVHVATLSRLFTVDVSDPDAPHVRGSLELGYGEQLFATRFTENKAFVVTFEQVDPLWVIDLTDADHPTITGELVVPGFSTQLVALPGRLVALGVDPQGGWRTTVSLFDVSGAPELLTRVDLGAGTSSLASGERKAFGVFPELGLVLVPVSGEAQKVAVLDLGATTLALRGMFETRQHTERAFPYANTVCAITPQSVVVANAASLAVETTIVLAEDVVDTGRIGPAGAGRNITLVADGFDARVGGVPLHIGPERLISHGRSAAVTGWDEAGRAAYVVDFRTTPPHVSPRIDLGVNVLVPYGGGPAGGAIWAGPAASAQVPDALLTPAGRLVLRARPSPNDVGDLELGEGAPRDGFVVVDLATSTVTARIVVRGVFASGTAIDGETLALTLGGDAGFDDSSRPLARHNFHRVDLTTLAVTAEANVPGALLAITGDRVFTVEDQWNTGWSVRTSVVASELRPARAVVLDREPLPDGAFDLRVAGATLYYTVSTGEYGPVFVAYATPWAPTTEVRTLRLGATLQAGPTIDTGDAFATLLLVEPTGALVVRNGVSVERYDVSGSSAVLEWSRDIGLFPRTARADLPAGSYVLALGFGGTTRVP